MSKTATLQLEDKSFEIPVIEGTEGEKALDIVRLREQTGYITHDPGYANTGSCLSSITYIDGDKGILRYRGIDIGELCEKSTFMEVAYLLIYGKLPTEDEHGRFKEKVHYHSLIHEDMKSFFTSYPGHAHPMAILSAMVCSLSVYHPELLEPDQSLEERDQTISHLLSKVRVLAAFAYKRSVGEAFVYTRPELDYLSNFMHMMFTTPMREYLPDEVTRKALDVLFILHADHEQNCSTSTVRMV
ncbi:MAG: citrate/2-methylcitrate synthase, partial [Methylococcaceae bacterium]|nr:citrate/2-methylcitrate synthase [Methylococcaceae bacterium]